MKICDLCGSKEVNYKMRIEQIRKDIGLASWDLDFCPKCVEAIETILQDALNKIKE